MFTRAAIAALLAMSAPFAQASPITQKLKPVSEGLTELIALTELLEPSGVRTSWENPAIPGHAADRKQALSDAGCEYDFPDGSQPVNGGPGVIFGHIEISGKDCPLFLTADVGGSMVDNKIDALINMHYELKNQAAFPKDDLKAADFKIHLSGTIEGNQAAGFVKLNVTGDMQGSGVSKSQGAFTTDGKTTIQIDFSGLNFTFGIEENDTFVVGGQSGTFKSQSKMQFFSAEEHYFIDGKEVSKDAYRSAMGEFKFPFFNTGMSPKSDEHSSCRTELYRKSQTTLAALQDYVSKGTPLAASPVKMLNSCQTNMQRETEWDSLKLTAGFQFGKEYLRMNSTFTDAAGKAFSAKPLYVVYQERQGRVEEAGPEHYFVQICEPVAKCE